MISKEGDIEKEKEYIQKLVKSQPPHNLTMLKFFIKFLAKIAENSAENKMTIKQISEIFAPALILPKDLLYFKQNKIQLAKKFIF